MLSAAIAVTREALELAEEMRHQSCTMRDEEEEREQEWRGSPRVPVLLFDIDAFDHLDFGGGGGLDDSRTGGDFGADNVLLNGRKVGR